MQKTQGFVYKLTMREMAYLLFKKKICPKCRGKMQRTKEYEITSDFKYTNMSPTSYDSILPRSVKKYTFHYICQKCKSKFLLAELAKKR